MPAPDHVFAPAGFLFIVLVCLVPAHALGLEHAVKSEVVVDGTNLDRFGTVDVQSTVPDIDPASLHAQLRALSGGLYSAEAIDKTVETMTVEISKRGHAFIQVRPRIDPDVAAHTVNVVFVVEEGPHVHVERITVRGNSRTRGYVIRREFDIAEDDAYNTVLIDRAERRLKNLGYFKAVKITSEAGSAPDRVVVNVDVEEPPNPEFSIHGGYNR